MENEDATTYRNERFGHRGFARFADSHPLEARWIATYRCSNAFARSLYWHLRQFGSLTPAQLDAIRRAM